MQQVNNYIRNSSLAMNEGYPMLICGNIAAFIVNKLNASTRNYRFDVFPVVYEAQDHRRDKCSDYVVLILFCFQCCFPSEQLVHTQLQSHTICIGMLMPFLFIGVALPPLEIDSISSVAKKKTSNENMPIYNHWFAMALYNVACNSKTQLENNNRRITLLFQESRYELRREILDRDKEIQTLLTCWEYEWLMINRWKLFSCLM